MQRCVARNVVLSFFIALSQIQARELRPFLVRFLNGAKLALSDGKISYFKDSEKERVGEPLIDVGEDSFELIPETHEKSASVNNETFLIRNPDQPIIFIAPESHAVPVAWNEGKNKHFVFINETGKVHNFKNAEKLSDRIPEDINVRTFSFRTVQTERVGAGVLAVVSDKPEGLNGGKGWVWLISPAGEEVVLPNKVPFNFKFAEIENYMFIETDAQSEKLLRIDLSNPRDTKTVKRGDIEGWASATKFYPRLGFTQNEKLEWFSNTQKKITSLMNPAEASAIAAGVQAANGEPVTVSTRAANSKTLVATKIPEITGDQGKQESVDKILFRFAKKLRLQDLQDFGYDLPEFKPLLVSLLSRQSKSLVVTGGSGGGKTTFVEGFARNLLAGKFAERGFNPEQTEVIQFSAVAMTSGNRYTGMDEANVQALIKYAEWRKANGINLVVLVDEIHALIGAGRSEGNPIDLLTHMQTPLANGNLQIIGTTTAENYSLIAAREDLARRLPAYAFPTVTQAQVAEKIAHWSKVYKLPELPRETLEFVVNVAVDADSVGEPLSRAAKFLDRLYAEAEYEKFDLTQTNEVKEFVVKAAASFYGFNVQDFRPENLDANLALIEEKFTALVGFEEAKARMMDHYIRSVVRGSVADKAGGLDIFLGPEGLGKTTFAEIMAYAFGRPIIKLPMSVYLDKEMLYADVARAAKANPYSLVFFEEIGEASREIQAALNSLLDSKTATADLNYGKTADSHTRVTVDLSKLLVMASTNKGDSVIKEAYRDAFRPRQISFFNPGKQAVETIDLQKVRERAIAEGMLPSLLDRFRINAVTYDSEQAFRDILRLNFDKVFRILNERNQTSFKLDETVREGYVALLMKKHFNEMASPRHAIKELTETLENYYALKQLGNSSAKASGYLAKSCATILGLKGN